MLAAEFSTSVASGAGAVCTRGLGPRLAPVAGVPGLGPRRLAAAVLAAGLGPRLAAAGAMASADLLARAFEAGAIAAFGAAAVSASSWFCQTSRFGCMDDDPIGLLLVLCP